MDINWNGTGAPPVGAICEVRAEHIREGDWIEVKVLALGLHGKDVAVLVAEHADGVVTEMHGLLYTRFEDHFRPIKTKEQLAAEEREKAIEDMVDDILRNTTGIDHKEAWCCSTALHDAGYRKQENNDAKA